MFVLKTGVRLIIPGWEKSSYCLESQLFEYP